MSNSPFLQLAHLRVFQIIFPSNTLIYGISRDGSKIFNIRTCEHMILGQLSIWEHVKRKMHSWYPCASMSQLLSYLEGLGSVIFKCLNNIYVLSFSTSLSCFQYIRGEHENARFKEMMKVASFPSPVGIPLTLRTKCKLLSFFKFTFPNISESKVLSDSQSRKYSSECAFLFTLNIK